MEVILQYFDGCPNWIDAESRIKAALEALGWDVELTKQKIETMEDAIAAGFAGSPTILVDGVDPFAVDSAEPGLACRVYSTPDGLRGTPSAEQLLTALAARHQ